MTLTRGSEGPKNKMPGCLILKPASLEQSKTDFKASVVRIYESSNLRKEVVVIRV